MNTTTLPTIIEVINFGSYFKIECNCGWSAKCSTREITKALIASHEATKAGA